MALNSQDIADMVVGTLNELGRNSFANIAPELQEYPVMRTWLKKNKVIFDSGIGIKRTLMTKTGGAAKHSGLFETDNVNVPDLLSTINIPWRHADTHWAFERRETLQNRGEALIVNVIKPRRAAATIDMAQLLEDAAWTLADPSDDSLPYGIPYYIVKNSATGFNGGNPTGYSDVAGLSSTVDSKWKNYTAQYASVSKADLVAKMRTAHRKIRFKSPITINDFRGSMGEKYQIYTNETVIQGFENLGEAQNENLGRDIASMDDRMVFRKNPINWIPKLDSDTTDPVYMIDHSKLTPVVLKGDFLLEHRPEKAAKQHNTFVVFVDLTYNFLCWDRRAHAVLNTA